MWSATDFSIAACQTSFSGWIWSAGEGSASRLWSAQFTAKPNVMQQRCNLDSQLSHYPSLSTWTPKDTCRMREITSVPHPKKIQRRLLRLLRQLRLLGLCLSRLGSSMTAGRQICCQTSALLRNQHARWQVWHLDRAVQKCVLRWKGGLKGSQHRRCFWLGLRHQVFKQPLSTPSCILHYLTTSLTMAARDDEDVCYDEYEGNVIRKQCLNLRSNYALKDERLLVTWLWRTRTTAEKSHALWASQCVPWVLPLASGSCTCQEVGWRYHNVVLHCSAKAHLLETNQALSSWESAYCTNVEATFSAFRSFRGNQWHHVPTDGSMFQSCSGASGCSWIHWINLSTKSTF